MSRQSGSQLESILSRIKRSTSSNSDNNNGRWKNPPEEASSSLGRHLASHMINDFASRKSKSTNSNSFTITAGIEKDESFIETIIENPTCACSFFDNLSFIDASLFHDDGKYQSNKDTEVLVVIIRRWKSWIPLLEKNCQNNILISKAVHGLVSLIFSCSSICSDMKGKSKNKDEMEKIIVDLYMQCTMENTKLSLLEKVLLISSKYNENESICSSNEVQWAQVNSILIRILTAVLLTTTNMEAQIKSLSQPSLRMRTYLQRHCRTICKTNTKYSQHLLLLQYKLLHIYVISNIGYGTKITYSIDWISDLLELSTYLLPHIQHDYGIFVKPIIHFLLEQIFPILSSSCENINTSLEYMINFLTSLSSSPANQDQVQDQVQVQHKMDFQQNQSLYSTTPLVLSEMASFRMGVCILSTPDDDGIDSWLQICLLLLQIQNHIPILSRRIYWILGCVFSTSLNPSINLKANLLLDQTHSNYLFNDIEPTINGDDNDSDISVSLHLHSPSTLLNLCNNVSKMEIRMLSSSKQSALLLSSLLHLLPRLSISSSKNQYTRNIIAFLQKILVTYPSLNIRFFPVAISFLSINYNAHHSLIMDILSLLCVTSSKDAHCTRQLWNFLHNVLPLTVQPTVIRLYPLLHASNTRTFSKISTQLTIHSQNPSTEIRMAVGSTISDLCRESNSSAFVETFIGIIQTHLLPDTNHDSNVCIHESNSFSSFIVSTALQSLHHLCEHGILDFSVMYKVLKNRMGWKWKGLCHKQDIVDTILHDNIDFMVLKKLVTLFGNGGGEPRKDDMDNEGENRISIQLKDTVRFLIFLSISLQQSFLDGENNVRFRIISDQTMDIQDSICISLSKFSLNALGLGETEEIMALWNDKDTNDLINEKQNETEAVERYHELSKIIVFNLTSKSIKDIIEMEGIIYLAHKILQMEETLLGSHGLWKNKKKKRNRRHMNKDNIEDNDNIIDSSKMLGLKRTPKKVIDALPHLDISAQYYKVDPNGASATAALLCVDPSLSTNSDHDPCNFDALTEDLVTILNDLTLQHDVLLHPGVRLHSIWAYVSTAQQIWFKRIMEKNSLTETDKKKGTTAKRIHTLIQQILSMRDVMETPDGALLLLASLGIVMQRDEELDIFPILQIIHNEIWNAFKNSFFHHNDEAHICLGMLGVCHAHNKSWKMVDDIVREISVRYDTEMKSKCENKLQGVTTTQTSYFGSYIGLGLLAQNIGHTSNSGNEDDRMNAQRRIKEIIGIMLQDLVSLISPSAPFYLSKFIAFLKNAETGCPNFLEELKDHIDKEEFCIKEGYRTTKFKSLSLGIGLGVSSLRHLHSELSSCLVVILRKCDAWLALPQAMQACRNIVDEVFDDLNKICLHRLKNQMNQKNYDEVGDIFFALAQTTCRIPVKFTPVINTYENLLSMLLQYIELKDASFSSRERTTLILAACISVTCMPSFSSEDRSYFQTMKIYHFVQPSHIKRVVKSLKKIIENDEYDEQSRGTAMIAIGTLACIKITDCMTLFDHYKQEKQTLILSSRASIEGQKKSNKNRELSTLPVPGARDGTLLCKILLLLEDLFATIDSFKSRQFVRFLGGILSSLLAVTLPGTFATMIETILQSPISDLFHLKICCLKLLTKQIENRRRLGTTSDEAFINLHTRIASLPVTQLESLLSIDGMNEFLKSLTSCLHRYPSGRALSCMVSLWKYCCHMMDFKTKIGNSHACHLLKSIKICLQNTSMKIKKDSDKKRNKKFDLSLETCKALVHLISNEIFFDIKKKIEICYIDGSQSDYSQQNKIEESQIRFDSSSPIWSEFCACMMEIPITSFEEQQFFTFIESKNPNILLDSLVRVNAITYLAHHQYFSDYELERDQYELDRLRSWLLKWNDISLLSNVQKEALSLTTIHIARSVSLSSTKEKAIGYLMNSFEVLLVDGFDNMCFEFLAIQTAYWFYHFLDNSKNLTVLSHSFNSIEALTTSYIYLCQQCESYFNSSYTHVTSIIDSCIDDLPIQLAYMSMELDIASEVFYVITKILKEHESKDDGTGKINALRDTLLHYQNEEVAKIKFAAYVSSHIMI